MDVSQLKQRIIEVLDAEAELKRLTSKAYVQLSMEEKYTIRHYVIVLAAAPEPQREIS